MYQFVSPFRLRSVPRPDACRFHFTPRLNRHSFIPFSSCPVLSRLSPSRIVLCHSSPSLPYHSVSRRPVPHRPFSFCPSPSLSFPPFTIPSRPRRPFPPSPYHPVASLSFRAVPWRPHGPVPSRSVHGRPGSVRRHSWRPAASFPPLAGGVICGAARGPGRRHPSVSRPRRIRPGRHLELIADTSGHPRAPPPPAPASSPAGRDGRSLLLGQWCAEVVR